MLERFADAIKSLDAGLELASTDAVLLSLRVKAQMAIEVDKISSGVWAEVPVAYSKEAPNPINYDPVFQVIDMLINKGVTALVAGSEMSELSQLTDDELLSFVEKVAQRGKERKISVLAGVPLRRNPQELASLCVKLYKKGAVGLIVDMGCFGKSSDSETAVIENLKAFASLLIAADGSSNYSIPVGLLESKERKTSPALLKSLVELGIVSFIIESSGSGVAFQEKINALGDFKRSLKLFNSNSTTYLASLNMGGSGFIGSQASFAPRLFSWLWQHFKSHPAEAELLVAMLSISEPTFKKYSPLNLKLFYRLHCDIESFEPVSRVRQTADDLEESAMRLGHLAAAIKYAEDFLEHEARKKKDHSVLL